MSETAAPATTACRTFAPLPTRYAAVIVLPCPGPSACSAPKAKAARSETISTIGVSRHLTSAAKDPPEATGEPVTVRAPDGWPMVEPVAAPGSKEKAAELIRSGLDSSDTG